MEGILLMVVHTATTIVIWVTWCPQYDNLPYCLRALQDITVLYDDYRS